MKANSANAVWSGDARAQVSARDEAVFFPAHGCSPHGAAEIVSVRGALENGARARKLLDRLLTAARLAPVCLHPVDLPAGQSGVASWRRFCAWLRDAATRQRVSLDGLATCIHSHHLPLADFHAATDSYFGRGQRFVLLDGLQMQSQRNERVASTSARNWTYLWRESVSSQQVFPVYGGFVRSTCPLLADEAAVTVLPSTGLLVPAHSAWLPVHLDLAALADKQGCLDPVTLSRVLQDTLEEADRRISCSQWPGRRRQADARLNRRIGLVVSGIGDLVVRRDQNPGDLDCLKSLQGLITTINRSLHACTASLSRKSGEVPSLSRACPPGNWFEGPHHHAWQARFEEARLDATVRHRNLLAMSPYSVLPACTRPSPRFMDLLPLLALADAWSFAGKPGISGWNVTQFKHFHRRARAIIQASQHASRVAAGV